MVLGAPGPIPGQPSPAWDAEMDWRTGTHRPKTSTRPAVTWTPPPQTGVLPKRPLGFFEVLDAGFRLLRFAPGLTVGLSLIVFTLWTLAIVAVLAAVFAASSNLVYDILSNSQALSGFSVFAQLGSIAASLMSLSLVHFLAGTTALGTDRAFGLERMSLPEAWAASHGVRWRLIVVTGLMTLVNVVLLAAFSAPMFISMMFGNEIVIVLLAVLGLLAWVPAMVFINIKFVFIGPVITRERLPLKAALARSWQLSGRGFWRSLGQLALGYFLSNQLVSIIITPIVMAASIVFVIVGLVFIDPLDNPAGSFMTIYTGFLVLIGFFTLASAAVLFAYLAALVSAVYMDVLMRTEAYDLVLLRDAERVASAALPGRTR